jgi:hypothetical protein
MVPFGATTKLRPAASLRFQAFNALIRSKPDQVDEVDRIHTTQPALRGYLDTAAALLASRGHSLEVGGRLHRLPDPPGVVRRSDRVAWLAPPAARAAELFAQNLAVWRDSAVAAGIATEAALDRLAVDLHAVAMGSSAGTITWELRQLAFQRA